VSSYDERSRTAFVFAGGGSFGAIHVGMLHSLASRGIAADIVVGSSVGALNGAYYAGNPTIEGIQRLDTIWRGLRRSDVFPLTWRTITLEDVKLPVHIVATDILSGGTVVISEGPAAQPIIASAAVPAAFEPVHFNDLYLADGAISSSTPVTVAVARGARRLIVLPTGYACALEKPPAGAVAKCVACTDLADRTPANERVTKSRSQHRLLCCAAAMSADRVTI
jgi:NTE family protein